MVPLNPESAKAVYSCLVRAEIQAAAADDYDNDGRVDVFGPASDSYIGGRLGA
jgi:hypothetical protein